MNRLIFFIFKIIARFKYYLDRRATTAGKIFLFITVVSLFFGLNPERNMFFQLFPILFILLLIGFLLSLRLKVTLRCNRTLPATCVAESRVSYPIKFSNDSDSEISGILFREYQHIFPLSFHDAKQRFDSQQHQKPRSFFSKSGIEFLTGQFFPPRSLHPDEFELPKLSPGTGSEQKVFLSPKHRGNNHFDGFLLFRKDPFGLFFSATIIQDPANLLVLPKLYPAAKLQFDGGRKYNQGGITASKDHGDSEEFISLREYTQGDPLKHIDWKSSAKTGNIIVKQFKSEYFSRYGMVLDTFCTTKNEDLFESAVSVAASLFMAQDLGESVLDLLFVGDRCYQETTSQGSNEQVHFLKILASVQGCYDNRFHDLHALVKGHLDQLSGLVMIFFNLDEHRKELVKLVNTHKIPNTIILLCRNKEKTRRLLDKLDWKEPIYLIENDKIEEQLPAI